MASPVEMCLAFCLLPSYDKLICRIRMIARSVVEEHQCSDCPLQACPCPLADPHGEEGGCRTTVLRKDLKVCTSRIA